MKEGFEHIHGWRYGKFMCGRALGVIAMIPRDQCDFVVYSVVLFNMGRAFSPLLRIGALCDIGITLRCDLSLLRLLKHRPITNCEARDAPTPTPP